MSRLDSQIKLRLPPDLKTQLVYAAAVNGRSINAEIVNRLEASFTQAEMRATLNKEAFGLLRKIYDTVKDRKQPKKTKS